MEQQYIFLSVTQATVLWTLFTSLVVPFVVSFIKKVHWPDGAKWTIAALTSLVGAYLSLAATGNFTSTIDIIIVGAAILTAATGWYHSWFKGLGLESWFNPPQTIATETADAAAAEVHEAVKEIVETHIESTPQ